MMLALTTAIFGRRESRNTWNNAESSQYLLRGGRRLPSSSYIYPFRTSSHLDRKFDFLSFFLNAASSPEEIVVSFMNITRVPLSINHFRN